VPQTNTLTTDQAHSVEEAEARGRKAFNCGVGGIPTHPSRIY